ncbi:VOC family protein [Spongiimicrobium salis]|uniref:VOC family protein n=1 Tax=Spongiimicrobium salis TaxID=1667022 RepID=UPI00374D9765
MKQRIALLSLVVDEYDKAIAYYTTKLGFILHEDTALGDGKRWVVIRPKGSEGSGILLAKANDARQKAAIGNQTGGRVFLFLYTDDFWGDYTQMQKEGVEFLESPREEVYGRVVVFKDLYGNTWDLLEPK